MILLLTRSVNLFKIAGSYLLSRISKRAIHWGNPVAASIEPNNCCNLHCPECPAGMNELTRPRGFMGPELFQSVISQLLPHLSYLTLYFQGEPYLSRQLFDFIALAKSKKIFVATSTNGHFLDEISVRKTIESGLDRLIISLDGADQQSYGSYRRGGDFGKVISGIRLLVAEKQRLASRIPQIILQCLVLRSNEHQLDEIRSLARELGVDKLEFKTAQFNDFENGNPLMPVNQRYSRYWEKVTKSRSDKVTRLQGDKVTRLQGDKVTKLQSDNVTGPLGHRDTGPLARLYAPKNPMPDSCFRMWSSCVVTWDGKVVPCCFDKDASQVLGDLAETSFREIWKGERYRAFRKRILQNRKSVGICRNCSQAF